MFFFPLSICAVTPRTSATASLPPKLNKLNMQYLKKHPTTIAIKQSHPSPAVPGGPLGFPYK